MFGQGHISLWCVWAVKIWVCPFNRELDHLYTLFAFKQYLFLPHITWLRTLCKPFWYGPNFDLQKRKVCSKHQTGSLPRCFGLKPDRQEVTSGLRVSLCLGPDSRRQDASQRAQGWRLGSASRLAFQCLCPECCSLCNDDLLFILVTWKQHSTERKWVDAPSLPEPPSGGGNLRFSEVRTYTPLDKMVDPWRVVIWKHQNRTAQHSTERVSEWVHRPCQTPSSGELGIFQNLDPLDKFWIRSFVWSKQQHSTEREWVGLRSCQKHLHVVDNMRFSEPGPPEQNPGSALIWVTWKQHSTEREWVGAPSLPKAPEANGFDPEPKRREIVSVTSHCFLPSGTKRNLTLPKKSLFASQIKCSSWVCGWSCFTASVELVTGWCPHCLCVCAHMCVCVCLLVCVCVCMCRGGWKCMWVGVSPFASCCYEVA